MTNNDSYFLYFSSVVFIGFSILIYFLLKHRKSFQKNNLEITADEVWNIVSLRAKQLHFLKSNLLFGIWQDATFTKLQCLAKDSNGLVAGEVLIKTGTRVREKKIEDKAYVIEFSLTWNRTAILRSANSSEIIAKYKRTIVFSKHEFEVAGFGVIKSRWPGINFMAHTC